ncbi:MAG: hypothetical protein MRY57_00395 [Candidatus Pacebacteria bacterium]|nr:hypothetical protein [Candidatus Paceibacterota bacterium]
MNNQDLFSAVIPIINEYILLAFRKNLNPNSPKKYVAGNPGGVRYADPTKNGPEELQYSHTSKEIVKGMFKHVIKMGTPKYEKVEHFDILTGGIADHINEHIAGAAKINAVKEGIEESGTICLELDEIFEHEQENKYGPQYFYLATKMMKFNGDIGDFEIIEDLAKQLPREGIDYICLDNDIDHIRAIHLSEVFSHPDFDVIPSHRKPIEGAIAHYHVMKR